MPVSFCRRMDRHPLVAEADQLNIQLGQARSAKPINWKRTCAKVVAVTFF